MSYKDKYHSYLPAERQQRIIDILKKDFSTRSSNLSELLGVISELETVNMTAELVLLPGTYNPTTHALVGPLTMEMIRQVNATKVFIGADGLSLNAGVSTPDLEIAAIVRSMIQQTRGQVIVMADHPKFGMVAEISIAPLKHMNVLITNRKIPSGFQKYLDKMGVHVVIAS